MTTNRHDEIAQIAHQIGPISSAVRRDYNVSLCQLRFLVHFIKELFRRRPFTYNCTRHK